MITSYLGIQISSQPVFQDDGTNLPYLIGFCTVASGLQTRIYRLLLRPIAMLYLITELLLNSLKFLTQ
jgi:hypothetical protein